MQKVAFKKRAPRALRVVRQFASKVMMTTDVRIDTKLNKQFPPSIHRVKQDQRRVSPSTGPGPVRYSHQDEEAKEKMFTLVQHVPVESFKGLQTENVRDE
eukprot:g12783.t1